ncbi:uncharacterized protein LOC122208794 [Panthera leo]|uniref:uncharacterized protein LOC122208794 n=1 Tax=Panthera leo TaxID=9689 RepID=UPI001C69CE34|nr:uncharacterized protein LOC122208794 [Panthera leo]
MRDADLLALLEDNSPSGSWESMHDPWASDETQVKVAVLDPCVHLRPRSPAGVKAPQHVQLEDREEVRSTGKSRAEPKTSVPDVSRAPTPGGRPGPRSLDFPGHVKDRFAPVPRPHCEDLRTGAFPAARPGGGGTSCSVEANVIRRCRVGSTGLCGFEQWWAGRLYEARAEKAVWSVGLTSVSLYEPDTRPSFSITGCHVSACCPCSPGPRARFTAGKLRLGVRPSAELAPLWGPSAATPSPGPALCTGSHDGGGVDGPCTVLRQCRSSDKCLVSAGKVKVMLPSAGVRHSQIQPAPGPAGAHPALPPTSSTLPSYPGARCHAFGQNCPSSSGRSGPFPA